MNVLPHLRQQLPYCGLLGRRKSEEVRFVPPRDKETMAWTQGVGVGKRHCQIILGNETSTNGSVAKYACHESAPYHGHSEHVSARFRGNSQPVF